MVPNYGNSFNVATNDYAAGKVPIWLFVDELYPAGCTLNEQTPGTTIPAGTPVYVPKMGGEATVFSSSASAGSAGSGGVLEVTGLLLEDVYIGTEGATGTIVTKGQVLAARIPELSDDVKAAIAGRITLVNE